METTWTTGKIWSAVVAGVVPLIVSSILGYLFRPGAWFKCLNKPCIMPPGWIFAVVWTILYPILGVAMVIACYGTDQPWTWVLPVVNILVSLMFTPLMFGWHSLKLGAIITGLCLLFGIGLILQYAINNHSPLAATLMIPYVVWLVVATSLSLWMLKINSCSKIAECEKKTRQRSCIRMASC